MKRRRVKFCGKRQRRTMPRTGPIVCTGSALSFISPLFLSILSLALPPFFISMFALLLSPLSLFSCPFHDPFLRCSVCHSVGGDSRRARLSKKKEGNDMMEGGLLLLLAVNYLPHFSTCPCDLFSCFSSYQCGERVLL